MQLTINSVKVSVDEAEITRMLMERLMGKGGQINSAAFPKIGDHWIGQGGIFTGIGRGRDGEPDQIIITADVELEIGGWNELNAAAKDYTADGHHDFSLPWRTEQSLQFANIKERFKEEAYWSCEQHREGSGYAWYQSFFNGNQSISHKGFRLRGVAVRRIPFVI
jgi:hypothetical protein